MKWASRKLILTVLSMGLLTYVVMTKDLETAKWFGGALAALAGSYNIGQGMADKKK